MYNANGDKVVRKFLPVQIYDIHGIELWLEELSAQGLILDSFGLRYSAYFRVGEPEAGVRYRLEPMTYWDRSLDYEKNDAYAQEGWEYVDFISRYYYIYRCRDSSAPDLHTDPITQSLVFDRMFKRRLPVFLLFVPLRIFDYLSLPFVLAQNGAQALSEVLYSLVLTPWLEIVLYDTRSPAFAQAVLDRRDKEGWHKLSHPGIDELYANAPLHGEPSQELLILRGRAGSRYFTLYFGGVKDPWTRIDRFLTELVQLENA